jgi:hypothetical protein
MKIPLRADPCTSLRDRATLGCRAAASRRPAGYALWQEGAQRLIYRAPLCFAANTPTR